MSRCKLSLFGLVLVFAVSASPLAAQQVHETGLIVETFVSGLAKPTGITFIAPDRMWVTEQSTGKVRQVINGVLQATPVLDLPVATGLEPGLLSIVKHPDFKHNGYVYVYYTRSTMDGGPRLSNRIARFTWNGTVLDPASEFTVHDLPAGNSSHEGGIIAFGLDGTIFAIIGDQHLDEQTANFPSGGPHEIGGVFRFNQDGSIPADNPFTLTGWRYFYAYGMRNSFGIAVDPWTGKLWQSENGEPLEEEINLVTSGMNGGWQDVFGFVQTNPTGLYVVPGSHYSNPKFEFKVTAAPTSVTFVTSPVLAPSRYRDMLVAEGNFSGNHRIFDFKLNDARDGLTFTQPGLQDMIGNNYTELQPIVFAENFGIITDVEVGPDGYLYVSDWSAQTVLRIRPNHPTGDVEHDGDVDLSDFARLQRCYSGTMTGVAAECAQTVDVNMDTDVDEGDYSQMFSRWSGPLELF